MTLPPSKVLVLRPETRARHADGRRPASGVRVPSPERRRRASKVSVGERSFAPSRLPASNKGGLCSGWRCAPRAPVPAARHPRVRSWSTWDSSERGGRGEEERGWPGTAPGKPASRWHPCPKSLHLTCKPEAARLSEGPRFLRGATPGPARRRAGWSRRTPGEGRWASRRRLGGPGGEDGGGLAPSQHTTLGDRLQHTNLGDTHLIHGDVFGTQPGALGALGCRAGGCHVPPWLACPGALPPNNETGRGLRGQQVCAPTPACLSGTLSSQSQSP